MIIPDKEAETGWEKGRVKEREEAEKIMHI